MPLDGKNGDVQNGSNGQDRPVIFQKYFKSGGRTYASQIKIASNGKRYLVLTEGVRDPETQEVKKHIIRVFESDLKDFFSMMQDTVLFLRSAKDAGSSVAGVVAAKPGPVRPAPVVVAKPVATAAKPVVAASKAPVMAVRQNKTPTNGNGKTVPVRTSKPAVPSSGRAAKPAYRPGNRGR